MAGRDSSRRTVRTVAHALVRSLTANGADVIFLNPGTDTAPIQEALLELHTVGVQVPRVIMCPHESVALAAAHGYYSATGRPQVVMVHVDVGTQNLGSMIHNAARGNAGVVIIAGRTPYTIHGELPGGRDLDVHWKQDVSDQAGIVRSYVKWTGDLGDAYGVDETLARAFQIATSAPAGPVYLTVPRETLIEPAAENAGSVSVRRHQAPAPPAPNQAALAVAARALLQAERPVIITSRLGQRPEAVAALVDVVELLGAVVVDHRERVNFPSSHAGYLHEADAVRDAIETADALLLIDCAVPWVPTVVSPPASAMVISMGIDPVHASMPGWTFPTDVALQCDSLEGLSALSVALRELGAASGTGQSADPPVDDGSAVHTTADGVMRATDVADVLNELLADEAIIVEEAVTNVEPLRSRLRRDQAGTYFRSGGAGLGWGLGAALGVKAAHPDRAVVSIVGDGSFMFGVPSAALWTLRESRTPVLIIVLRNGGYAASRRPVLDLFPDGASARRDEVVGTLFADSPDFALLAQACGARGEHVATKADFGAALQRALDVISDMTSVIVVDVSSPWISTPKVSS